MTDGKHLAEDVAVLLVPAARQVLAGLILPEMV
jgi:hypothetical protein